MVIEATALIVAWFGLLIFGIWALDLIPNRDERKKRRSNACGTDACQEAL